MFTETYIALGLLVVLLVYAILTWDARRQDERRRMRREDVQTWKDVLGL